MSILKDQFRKLIEVKKPHQLQIKIVHLHSMVTTLSKNLFKSNKNGKKIKHFKLRSQYLKYP
jgi:hypothetical protein